MLRASTVAIVFSAALACGCRRSTPRNDEAAMPPTQRKVALNVPLTYDTPRGRQASPMVDADVNGRRTKLIVDTGATYHALEGAFARNLGGASPSEEDATGHSGIRTRVGKIEAVTIVVSGQTAVRSASIPVVPPTADLREMEVGGVLSPQSLAPSGFTALVDLHHGRLVVLTGDVTSADRAGPGASLAPEGFRACSPERRYLVAATLSGHRGIFEIDTGSAETHVFAGSVAGRALAARATRTERRGSVSGEFSGEVVPQVGAVIGELRRTIDVLVIPGTPAKGSCSYDGMIGMDILAGCTIALDERGGVARCTP